jgi:hypothetical protein
MSCNVPHRWLPIPTLSKCSFHHWYGFQFLPWPQNKNIRFGLEVLYLTVDNFVFHIKTFQHFEVCLHNSFWCVKTTTFFYRVVISIYDFREHTVLPPPVGSWYNNGVVWCIIYVQNMASISPFLVMHKVLFFVFDFYFKVFYIVYCCFLQNTPKKTVYCQF